MAKQYPYAIFMASHRRKSPPNLTAIVHHRELSMLAVKTDTTSAAGQSLADQSAHPPTMPPQRRQVEYLQAAMHQSPEPIDGDLKPDGAPPPL